MSEYKVLPVDPKWYPLKGTITIGRVSGGEEGGSIRISLCDKLSHIEFAEIELSIEAFGMVISGMGSVEGRMVVRGLQNVGKKREWRTEDVLLPETLSAYSDRKPIREWLKANAQRKGWYLDTYLGSRDSVFTDPKTKDVFARVGYVRWVGKTPEEEGCE
jgi:hypothetical protein